MTWTAPHQAAGQLSCLSYNAWDARATRRDWRQACSNQVVPSVLQAAADRTLLLSTCWGRMENAGRDDPFLGGAPRWKLLISAGAGERQGDSYRLLSACYRGIILVLPA